MTNSRLDRIAAAQNEFKDAVLKGDDASAESISRFKLLKTKTGSQGNTVTNGAVIRDNVSGEKYSVSVTTVQPEKLEDREVMLALQASIARFLNTIHETI